MRKNFSIWLLVGFLALIVTSCLKDKSGDMEAKEKALLEQYLIDNNITVQPTESGLYYIETLAGTGEPPDSGNTVTVDYTGSLINGYVFDSSANRPPFSFVLGSGQVIPGWEEGISMMKKGGEATLIIPSSLAYGAYGYGYIIPPYSTLIFDVALTEIVR